MNEIEEERRNDRKKKLWMNGRIKDKRKSQRMNKWVKVIMNEWKNEWKKGKKEQEGQGSKK